MTIEVTADLHIRRRKILLTFTEGDTVNAIHDQLKQVPMGAVVDEVTSREVDCVVTTSIEFHHELIEVDNSPRRQG